MSNFSRALFTDLTPSSEDREKSTVTPRCLQSGMQIPSLGSAQLSLRWLQPLGTCPQRPTNHQHKRGSWTDPVPCRELHAHAQSTQSRQASALSPASKGLY